MIIKKIKSHPKAFSLIELSIVILIVSIIITGALTVSKTSIRNANAKITADKMSAIYTALTNFLNTNKRLPCPGVFTNINTSTSYGTEAATPGTCTGVINPSGFIIYGMVPTAALGLSSDMASDGFGTRFSYMVDRRFTARSTNPADTAGFEIIGGQQFAAGTVISTIINVKEGTAASNIDITTLALMAIISHGPNKLGGFSPSSTTANSTTNATSEENENLSTSANVVIYNSSTNSLFDDTILFKNKTQLIVDAGMEFIMCSYNESNYISGGTTTLLFPSPGVYYGQTKQSSNSCLTVSGQKNRRCGKYGVWGALDFACTN